MRKKKATELTLSEAILLGSIIYPNQGVNRMFHNETTACALGAAYAAAFPRRHKNMVRNMMEAPELLQNHAVLAQLAKRFPILNEGVESPISGASRSRIGRLCPLHYWITHLNDTYRWSREKISKSVRVLEERMQVK